MSHCSPEGKKGTASSIVCEAITEHAERRQILLQMLNFLQMSVFQSAVSSHAGAFESERYDPR